MKESARLRALKERNEDERRLRKVDNGKRRKRSSHVRRGSYGEKLNQAGISLPAPIWLLIVVGGALCASILLSRSVGHLVAVIVGPCICHFFLVTYLVGRAEKRRNNAVPHLPGFIDTLSASLAAGYNMEVAIEHAANSLPNGVLKNEFSRVHRMLEKGMNLDEALEFVSHRISGQEVVALVITIRMFSDMGGRVLTPFKRLGHKMREQQAVLERATRDLVGTKQAFFVILGLSIAAPVFMLVNDPNYVLEAFTHPTVKYVMQGAIVVQVICFMAFKKFTTIKI